MHKSETLLGTHSFTINDDIHLTTEYIGNGDPIKVKDGWYMNSKLILHGSGNEATFEITSGLTPQNLRKLADELARVEAGFLRMHMSKKDWLANFANVV
jgi:hypothetical protein